MAFTTMEIERSPNINASNEKVGKVLQIFLDPNLKVKNDVHLDLFLTHLASKNGDAKTSRVQADEQLKKKFCRWIIRASNLWRKSERSPSATILSFVLNLTSQLSGDEHTFVDLNGQNVFESLVGLAQANSTERVNVTLGMVTLFCSFLEHKSGIQWVVATTHWTDVIDLGFKVHTAHHGKKVHRFVVKLLEETISFNRNFAVNLVEMLIRPLKDVFRSLPNDEEIQNKDIFETLLPTLDFLSEVLSTMLKNFNLNILQLFLEQGTQKTAQRLLLLSQSEDFSFNVLQVLFVFLFCKLCVKVVGVKVVSHDSLALCDITAMFDLIKNEMLKDNSRCVIKICDYAHCLYCSLAVRLPLLVRGGEVVEFQNQMVLFQLMPVLVFSVQILGSRYSETKNDAVRKVFYKKLMRMFAMRSLEICYKWQDVLKAKPDLMDDVIFSLQYLAKVTKMLSKERAAILFPALVYALKDTLTVMRVATSTSSYWTARSIKYINTLLETIVDLVESFDLTWKDSIETIHVLDLAFEFLQYSKCLDKKIILRGLQLLKTAISKYMSADMVLLIYSRKDSTVSQTGSLLYARCQDGSWEIRDRALEVVFTLSRNANSMFPALTNVLLDAELPQLVANMARKDEESSVRATALKCLQELIQISEIWDVLLSVESFLDNLLSVFESEAEGIVRKEAAILVHKIYNYQEFPDEILPRLYDVMTHAAIGDLHWEVKYEALDFWFGSWKQHLTNQGMIDRTFPSHTFSKEHKKIVALTEAEIRKRVIKVLNQLSQTGCLHVLKYAIQNDCDVDVSKKAISFSVELLELFTKYNVPYENIDSSDPSSPPIVQSDPQYRRLFEPVSPASSTTMTAPSPADIGDLGSPQVPQYPQLTEPVSPASSTTLTAPSPADIGDLGSPQVPRENVDLSEPLDSPIVQSKPQNPQLIEPASPASSTTMTAPSLGDIVDLGSPQIPLENMDLSDSLSSLILQSDPQNPQLFDPASPASSATMTAPSPADIGNLGSPQAPDSPYFDLLSLFPSLFSPTTPNTQQDNAAANQVASHLPPVGSEGEEGSFPTPTLENVINDVTKIKTRTYLAPSEFLRFIYNEIETLAIKSQQPNSLDEFDSLLDDILKEYDTVTDVDSIDCY